MLSHNFILLLILHAVTHFIRCYDIVFSPTECLAAHNELRQLHENTNSVSYSLELEREAAIAARDYQRRDDTIDIRPTRVEPKRRRRRHTEDESKHLEEWDGDIYYPQRRSDINNGKTVRMGESIHKFCCKSFPHCPQRVFHNLHAPPSAAGVVKDWYNEEVGNYDFQTGKKKAQFSQIKEFASIVWRNTTMIGCAQSELSSEACFYTVVIYQVEGGVGGTEDFIKNIGRLKSDVEVSGNKIIITAFLVIFFIVLFVAAVVVCYFCRHHIQYKLIEIRIKTDTMKAEQELETDSTRFWWLRIFKIKKKQRRRTVVSRPKKLLLTERPTIEVVPNSAPMRTIRPSQRVRGNSNASSYIRYHGISRQPESVSLQDNYGYDNGPLSKPLPLTPLPYEVSDPLRNKAVRVPSLSGKAPPPEPPSEHPIYGNINPMQNEPIHKAQLKPPLKPNSQPVANVANPSVTTNNQQTSSKPDNSSTSGQHKPKVPLVPLVRNSPNTSPRPFSTPVSQPNKPMPVPRKNTAPVELSSVSTGPHVKPKPVKPPTTKPKPKV